MDLPVQEVAKDFVDGVPFEDMTEEIKSSVLEVLYRLFDANDNVSRVAKSEIADDLCGVNINKYK